MSMLTATIFYFIVVCNIIEVDQSSNRILFAKRLKLNHTPCIQLPRVSYVTDLSTTIIGYNTYIPSYS